MWRLKPNKAMKNIAVIQTAFIGDIALSLPLPQAIRNTIPDANITFITTPMAASLVRCADAVDEVIAFDKHFENKKITDLINFAEKIKKRKIDCVISPHRSLRSTLLSWLIKPKVSVGFLNAASSFLYSKRVAYHISLHETQRVLALLYALPEFANLDYVPKVQITIPTEECKIADGLWEHAGLHNYNVIAIAPGSTWATKRWPVSHFIQTIQEIQKRNYQAILLGSKEDAAICDEIHKETDAISFAGQTTLPQSMKILKHCKAILTNDSAPGHLAQLVEVPSVTIFGPTIPQFGFAPIGEHNRIIEMPNLSCRPCAIHGGKICPIGVHECMNNISPQTALLTLFQLLETISVSSKSSN